MNQALLKSDALISEYRLFELKFFQYKISDHSTIIEIDTIVLSRAQNEFLFSNSNIALFVPCQRPAAL